jgi:hypothetical protein
VFSPRYLARVSQSLTIQTQTPQSRRLSSPPSRCLPPVQFSVRSSPAPESTVDKISDLSGKVFIVTGGNAGIGKETCKQLLLKNAKVYLAACSESKAQVVFKELEKTGKKSIFLKLDLSNLDVIEESAEEFLECVSLLSPTA